ncbi:manganese catalase family protein [Pseudescherichia sp.]|uniref:manganese catalase family protein n=1 Tax=Pseudescherichia sp. TaxID=2055881 RepID=UPI002897FEDB|nr:manganese catalase family protein [Pseudescherichia sp.]
MFHHSSKMQFPVRVEKPDPEFAMLLQQAIGGVEGEIRVAMQYFFQAMGARGDARIRDLLISTATEELGHIEMLGYAVALNLEGAPLSYQEASAKDPVVNAILGGMNPRHILSSGLAALPVNANGVPFDMSHVYASGNAAADMISNVAAEATGRVLATRLYNLTEDRGMKDFLSFLIARDTMHQQQWMAVIEDMGGLSASLPKGRWSEGPAYDGRGQFTAKEQPDILGEEPVLGAARPGSGAQKEQIDGTVPPVSGTF